MRVGPMRIDVDLVVVGGSSTPIPLPRRVRGARDRSTATAWRPCHGCGPAHPGPRRAAVVRPVKPCFVNRRPRCIGGRRHGGTATPRRLGADESEHGGRVPWIDRQRDAADIVPGKAIRQLGPRPSRVRGLENAPLGSAANHLPHRAAALVRRRVEDVRILRAGRQRR